MKMLPPSSLWVAKIESLVQSLQNSRSFSRVMEKGWRIPLDRLTRTCQEMKIRLYDHIKIIQSLYAVDYYFCSLYTPFIHLFIHPSTHPPTHPFIHPSIHPSIHPFIHLSPVHLFVDSLVHPFICPIIHP